MKRVTFYGQEKAVTTVRLAKMNPAIRGIDRRIAHGDTLHNDRHPDLKADYILANPPFNISDWGDEHAGDRLPRRTGVERSYVGVPHGRF